MMLPQTLSCHSLLGNTCIVCFCVLLLGDDYDEFETLIAESLSPAEEDWTQLNDAVLDQMHSQQLERDKVEQVSAVNSCWSETKSNRSVRSAAGARRVEQVSAFSSSCWCEAFWSR